MHMNSERRTFYHDPLKGIDTTILSDANQHYNEGRVREEKKDCMVTEEGFLPNEKVFIPRRFVETEGYYLSAQYTLICRYRHTT